MKVGRTTVCLCMCLCFSFQSCVWAIISGFEHIFHFKIPHLPILEYLDFPVTFETIFDIWLQIAKYHCLHQTLWKTFYHQFVFRNFEFYSWENKIGAGIKYFSILSLHFSQPGLKMTKIKFHPVWETYCAETLAYNVSQKLLLGAVLQSFKRRACFACLRACVRTTMCSAVTVTHSVLSHLNSFHGGWSQFSHDQRQKELQHWRNSENTSVSFHQTNLINKDDVVLLLKTCSLFTTSWFSSSCFVLSQDISEPISVSVSWHNSLINHWTDITVPCNDPVSIVYMQGSALRLLTWSKLSVQASGMTRAVVWSGKWKINV